MKQENTKTYGYLSDKVQLLKRLARIEGQVRGVARMIEDDRYCIDILNQLSAANTALEAVGLKVLDGHVKSCVADALKSGNSQEADLKTAELLEAIARYTQTR